jgi:thiol-disulfide isomerase/thioredoxin
MNNTKQIYYIILLLIGSYSLKAQTLEIEFPKFAGKTFDFIIFQGDKLVKIYENDTIPKNGLVKIVIPKEYAPYTGMSRWLITNTAEGGGLDMAIPGYGFKVSCLSDIPDENNIKFIGFDAVNELNRINKEQQIIIDKFETMSKAAQLYGNNHPLFTTFSKEKEVQIAAYSQFHQELKKNTNYNARFLPILNLLSGRSLELTDDYSLRAKHVNHYIVNELNYDHFYTSGHWSGIIQSWVQMHTQLYNDKDQFVKDFSVITTKITDPKKYTDWVGKVTYYLTQYTKDDFIEAIAPLVINSKKITSYEGATMQVYLKAMIGSQAPDLVITEHIGKYEDHNHKTAVIKSKDFAQKGFQKTLLIFYQSGCGPCEELMQQLPGQYEKLKSKGIRIISISADESEQVFKNASTSYPWADKFCDYEGKKGINFRNYAVLGTPTLFLIDQKGKIEKKLASFMELLE